MDITEKIRKKYDRTSRYYDLMGALMEQGKMREWRRAIWQEVQGRALEVGVGTGRNIPFYPDDAEITAIDFSEKMLEKAREKAAKSFIGYCKTYFMSE